MVVPSGALQNSAKFGQISIFGVPFMSSYYSVWDMDNSQVSFTPNLETTATVATATAATTILPISKLGNTQPFDYKSFVLSLIEVYGVFAGLAFIGFQYFLAPVSNSSTQKTLRLLAEEVINKAVDLLL